MNFTKFKWWKKSNKNQHVKVDKIIYKADGSVSYIKLESYIYSQEIVDFEKYIAELEYVSNRSVVVSAKEELNRLKNEYIKSLVSEFPQAYINDVLYVNYIVLSTLGNQRKVVNTQKYILSSGEGVNIPKSFVYYGELSQTSIDNFSDTQKQIYYSLMTKNLDGYIRSKYLELILKSDLEEWQLPYIVEISGSYIYEVLEVLYNNLNSTKMKAFCQLNGSGLLRNYDRMISYWNCYHRTKKDNYMLKNYVGYKLFTNIYGYNNKVEQVFRNNWNIKVDQDSVCQGDDTTNHKII